MSIKAAEKLSELANKKIRIFHHESFDDPKKKKEILGDIPNYAGFQELQVKTSKYREKKYNPDHSASMRPCYEQPLLSREQEYHLFRKMNYFKYQAQKLLDAVRSNPELATRKQLNKVESYLRQATEVRNQIASSNFRLSSQILKRENTFYRERSLMDGVLSNAYMDIIKAIDYFDYRLGNKFSTYCTWVLKKNSSRDLQNQSKHYERYVSGSDDYFSGVESRNDGSAEESAQESRRKLVLKLLGMLADKQGDASRQIRAIRQSFGIDGEEQRTLKNISSGMKISKERVRQLKVQGLETLRQLVVEQGILLEKELDQ